MILNLLIILALLIFITLVVIVIKNNKSSLNISGMLYVNTTNVGIGNSTGSSPLEISSNSTINDIISIIGYS
ncbi:MAG: hypothetical protein AAB326_02920, partial [Pseudomonadota bacterium]